MRLTPDDPLARHVVVFLDGQDVTNRCTYADTQYGILCLFPMNWKEIDWQELRDTFHVGGNINVVIRPDAPEWARDIWEKSL